MLAAAEPISRTIVLKCVSTIEGRLRSRHDWEVLVSPEQLKGVAAPKNAEHGEAMSPEVADQ